MPPALVSIRPANKSRSRARPNVLQSRHNLLRDLRPYQRTDLGEEIAADHLIANINCVGKAFGVDSAMALYNHTFQSEQNTTIGFVRVELVTERLEGAAGKQIADLGLPAARHRIAQKIRHLARGARRPSTRCCR